MATDYKPSFSESTSISTSSAESTSETSQVKPTIYRGFVGVDIVNAYLLGLGWNNSRGLLVCSPEGYFFDLLYGYFRGLEEITIPIPEEAGRPWEKRQSIQGTVKYRIEKLTYARQYWSAIMVNSLVAAESIPGFTFIPPEEIYSGAEQYRSSGGRDGYYYYSAVDSMQSEYSLGETEYAEYMRLKALEKQLQTEKVLKRKVQERVKKWEKKEEAERQLIF